MIINQSVPTGATKQRSYDGDYMVRGREAEEIVINYLKSNPEILGVDDWRNLRQVQEADVDIAIKTLDGRVLLAEIKSDSYLGVSGNVLFEVLRINHTCQPDKAAVLGWSAKTPAKYILYYAPQAKKIYRFNSEKLRQAFQKYTMETRKNMRVSIVETDSIKTTINILIPIAYCKDAYIIYDPFDELFF